MQTLPVFLINLDRRDDRLAFMAGQLDAMGLSFERVSALDAASVPDDAIDPRIARSGHLIPMGRGSQCVATTTLALFARIAASEAEGAILLQDDAELSPELARFAGPLDWLAPEIGLVQLEKWNEAKPEKLTGPALGATPVPGRSLHRLYSRTGGAACFLIRREAAATIHTRLSKMAYPIDHLLFSPNVSPVFDEIGVGMVFPSLARQRMRDFKSDLKPWRRPMTRGEAFRRGLTEINRLPHQIAALLLRRARLRPATYAERTDSEADKST